MKKKSKYNTGDTKSLAPAYYDEMVDHLEDYLSLLQQIYAICPSKSLKKKINELEGACQ